VTLFPFLAVLMCTIGSLVLLLVVVSAQIRKDTVATAKSQRQQKESAPPAPPEPPPTPLTPEPDPPEFVQLAPEPDPEPKAAPILRASPRELAQIDELNALSQQFAAAVDQRARQRIATREKAAALREQLRLAASGEQGIASQIQLARARGQSAERQLRESRIEKRQIEELLDDSEELIKSRKKELTSPRYSIIPYDGQTGTIRRPIVIECTGASIRFAAEDIALQPSRLHGYNPDQNPLLSGVIALADYWAQSDRASGDGRVLRPYPLILVRPDGADTFDMARILLDRLTGNYGYELIEAEFDYALPPTTPEAIRQCQDAVDTAFELKPSPIRSLPRPRAVDSSFVRHTPPASGNFFKSDGFRKRGIAGGSGTGGGTDGSRPFGTGPGAGVPGLFTTQPATSPQPIGRPGSGRTQQQAGAGAGAPGSGTDSEPGGDSGSGTGSRRSTGARATQELPFELIDPFAERGESAAGGPISGTEADGKGSGTASNSEGSGPASRGMPFGSSSSGGPPGRPSNMRAARRWGISNPKATLELETKVTLIVRNDQIAVANRYAVSRKSGDGSLEMVNRTMQALEQVAREWGKPPERFYWVPSVTLGVAPDAGKLGALLTQALRKEGVEVKVVNVTR
jgi:hypothetical protein